MSHVGLRQQGSQLPLRLDPSIPSCYLSRCSLSPTRIRNSPNTTMTDASSSQVTPKRKLRPARRQVAPGELDRSEKAQPGKEYSTSLRYTLAIWQYVVLTHAQMCGITSGLEEIKSMRWRIWSYPRRDVSSCEMRGSPARTQRARNTAACSSRGDAARTATSATSCIVSLYLLVSSASVLPR